MSEELPRVPQTGAAVAHALLATILGALGADFATVPDGFLSALFRGAGYTLLLYALLLIVAAAGFARDAPWATKLSSVVLLVVPPATLTIAWVARWSSALVPITVVLCGILMFLVYRAVPRRFRAPTAREDAPVASTFTYRA